MSCFITWFVEWYNCSPLLLQQIIPWLSRLLYCHEISCWMSSTSGFSFLHKMCIDLWKYLAIDTCPETSGHTEFQKIEQHFPFASVINNSIIIEKMKQLVTYAQHRSSLSYYLQHNTNQISWLHLLHIANCIIYSETPRTDLPLLGFFKPLGLCSRCFILIPRAKPSPKFSFAPIEQPVALHCIESNPTSNTSISTSKHMYNLSHITLSSNVAWVWSSSICL